MLNYNEYYITSYKEVLINTTIHLMPYGLKKVIISVNMLVSKPYYYYFMFICVLTQEPSGKLQSETQYIIIIKVIVNNSIIHLLKGD